MQVGGIEITDADLGWIRERGVREDLPSRSRVAREFCDRKGLFDDRGRRREVAARVALGRLERAGSLSLPALRGWIPRPSGASPVSPPPDLYRGAAAEVRDLAGLEIVCVNRTHRTAHQQWKQLMESSHYLGAGPLCGAQLRYLVRCSEGLLGALAFSASAWRLGTRDRWIGWSERARLRNLKFVVANSRFLLVPRIPNLASHVLSRCVARLAADWQERYGYRPLLVESFVDSERFEGTCYRAAGWIQLGTTTGRGRQDRDHRRQCGVKEVFILPLDRAVKEQLCVEPVRELPTDRDWADIEFGDATLPDERLNKRLLSIARDFYARPTANIAQACGSRAKTKAVYRFCAHQDVSMEAILQPHYESSLSRAAQHPFVLAIQDTTTLNYTTHSTCEDLGPIGSFGAQATLGLFVHSTLLVNPAGTPLGLLNAQCWARDSDWHGTMTAKQRERIPIDQKESRKWMVGYEAIAQAQQRLSSTRLVCVADREADIFELFVRARQSDEQPELLVRATLPRKIEIDANKGEVAPVWEHVRSLPSMGTLPLLVPRRGSRPRRETTLELRFAEVSVRPPLGSKHKTAVKLWAIAATEASTPAQGEAVEWLLLTTMPVTSLEQAAEKLSWYALRWQIEVYHRTLKSGCRIENRQLASAHSLKVCIAVDLVVAWRIFHLAKLGREIPDVPCTVYFEDSEWKALLCFLSRTPTPPPTPPSLREAIHLVAGLGGFLGRKSDGQPGTQTLWIGLQRLDDIAATYRALRPSSFDSS